MQIIKNRIRTLGRNQQQKTQTTCTRLLKNDEIVNFTQVLQYFFDVDFCTFGGTSKSVKFTKRYAQRFKSLVCSGGCRAVLANPDRSQWRGRDTTTTPRIWAAWAADCEQLPSWLAAGKACSRATFPARDWEGALWTSNFSSRSGVKSLGLPNRRSGSFPAASQEEGRELPSSFLGGEGSFPAASQQEERELSSSFLGEGEGASQQLRRSPRVQPRKCFRKTTLPQESHRLLLAAREKARR